MSYGIIRIQKFNAHAVKGIEIHDQRKKDVSHTNPDIDRSKSMENYALYESDSFSSGVNQRIQELNLKKTPRKDAIVMCQALITSDKEFFDQRPAGQWKQFFVDAFKFVKEQYGAENIISATVHLDEKTPHLHVNFVPVTPDDRLSAKSLLTRESLRKLQTDFFYNVGAKYGLKRGESREEKRKHLSTEEYKQKTRKAHINEISASLDREQVLLDERQKKVDEQIEGIKNSAPSEIRKIKEADIWPKQFQKKKYIVFNQFEDEAQIADRLNKNFIDPLEKITKHTYDLSQRLRNVESDYKFEKKRLKNELKAEKEKSEKYDNLVQDLKPDQIKTLGNMAEEFRIKNDHEKELAKQNNRGRGMSR